MEQVGSQQNHQFKLLQNKYDELLSNVQRQQHTVTQSFRNVNQRLSTITSQNNRIEQDILATRDTIVQDLHNVRGHVSQRFDALQIQRAKDVLIKSLWYPEHELRRATVKPPMLRTFDWIFDEGEDRPRVSSREVTWSNFSKWLRQGTSLYWISGKAASGKSTLMAHISDHSTTRSSLGIWAAGKQLHLLCYYFWRPGSALQKNAQGLLRSLLIQIISEIPKITEDLASEFLVHPDTAPVWSTKQLVTIFERALAISDGSRHCFCMFIDGLDEFEGDAEELLELIFELERRPYVKCCVSSRPETQLKPRLAGYATLKLEDLNRDDITTYCREKLRAHQLAADIMNDIVATIVWRASGVFLWVVLVMKSITRGIESHDDTSLLLQRLDTYPRDMDELLKKMLQDVDEVHKQSLSLFLRVQMMFSKYHESVSITLLTAARGHNPLDYHRFIRMCEETEKQIVAQSRGLLEVCSERYSHEPHDVRALVGRAKRSEVLRQLSACIVPQTPIDRDAPLPLETPIDRQQAFSTRHLATPTYQMGRLLLFQCSNVQWIHRSAYDFFLLHGADWVSSSSNEASEFEVSRRLADASIKLFISMPWLGNLSDIRIADENSTLTSVSESAHESFDRCCKELFFCMHYAEDSISNRFLEFESLIDLMDGEALGAFKWSSVPSALDGCESHICTQYHKEKMKALIWVKALDLGFFQFAKSGISRTAKFRFAAASLAEMVEYFSYGTSSKDSLALELEILQILDSIYLKELGDSECVNQHNTASSVVNRWTTPVTWKPCKWPLAGVPGILEEDIMESVCSAFLDATVDFCATEASESAPQASQILDFLRALLPYLNLWDVHLPISYDGSWPMKLEIAHRNLLLLVTKQAYSPDSQLQMQDFEDVCSGRIRIAYEGQEQKQSFITGPTLSYNVTEQIVEAFQYGGFGFCKRIDFAAERELALAILKENTECGARRRDLVLACLYSLLDWQGVSFKLYSNPSLLRLRTRFSDDMKVSGTFPTHRYSRNRRASSSHLEYYQHSAL